MNGLGSHLLVERIVNCCRYNRLVRWMIFVNNKHWFVCAVSDLRQTLVLSGSCLV